MAGCEKIKYLASILFVSAFTTLVYRVYRTKDARDLSYLWMLLVIASQICLLIYGICNKQLEVIASSSYILVGALYIFHVKRIYDETENKQIMKKLKDKDIL